MHSFHLNAQFWPSRYGGSLITVVYIQHVTPDNSQRWQITNDAITEPEYQMQSNLFNQSLFLWCWHLAAVISARSRVLHLKKMYSCQICHLWVQAHAAVTRSENASLTSKILKDSFSERYSYEKGRKMISAVTIMSQLQKSDALKSNIYLVTFALVTKIAFTQHAFSFQLNTFVMKIKLLLCSYTYLFFLCWS